MRVNYKVTTASFVTLLAFSAAGTAFAQDIVSPDDPNKRGTSQPGPSIPIVMNADLVNTGGPPFACFTGLGPFTTAFRNIGTPDTWEFFRGFCTPGTTVDMATYRTTSAMDPAMHACEGDFTGQDTGLWSSFTCPAGSNFLDSGDDNIGPLCAGGSFSDPVLSFSCPATGVFTVAVYDFIGDGPVPEFEVHASGLTPPVPAVPPVGLMVLAALLLASAAFVLSRRRMAVS